MGKTVLGPRSLVLGKAGFSMVELLITVVLLTLGGQLIQGGFLRAAEMFGRYGHTMRAMTWAAEELSAAREEILLNEWEDREGTLVLGGKELAWTRQVRMLSLPNLFSVRVDLRWTENGRPYTYTTERRLYRRDMVLGE